MSRPHPGKPHAVAAARQCRMGTLVGALDALDAAPASVPEANHVGGRPTTARTMVVALRGRMVGYEAHDRNVKDGAGVIVAPCHPPRQNRAGDFLLVTC